MTRRDFQGRRHPRGRGRGRGRENGHGNGNTVPSASAPPAAPASLQKELIRGECHALCPAKEAAERARTQELSRFERPAADGRDLVAVKKYRRAAAGRDVWDPLELRPSPVLLRTLRHLFTTVLPWPRSGFDAWGQRESARPAEFLAVYHFVNDRVRSVRQDFTVQRIEDGTLVTALQQAARFYLLAGMRSVQLLDGVKRQQDWSDKLNDEQLASALSQLQALYGLHELAGFDHEDVPELKDAGEFVAYDLLLHADEPQDVAWMLLKLSPKLRKLDEVQRALRAFVALQTDDFHAFFAEFGAMSLLERAAALRHLPRVWDRGLRMINKGFGKQDRFPLEELARWMHLADPNSEGEGGELAERFCSAMNIQTQRHSPPPPPIPNHNDEVADTWEIVDELVSSPSVKKPSSIGFAQFKLAPLPDRMDPEATRPLLREVVNRIEATLAAKDALWTTTELIMGKAQAISTSG
ncbi:Nuclear protein export factor [Phytophthora cinnamomi]|uniref:Nuclear protein export factor n=1 Tax=Phytophthora cinnamomi TaxID=4785 RepID=UPI00355A2C07|nr:Nuclear protein export factor [Phytophthora cinnamomi]